MNDFTKPGDQLFRYRLVGYDQDWVDAGNARTATYTQVPGGNYTFQVIGANGAGVWNETPAVLGIHIATPFVKSVWFYALLLLTGLILIWVLYRYRLKQVQEKERLRTDFAMQLAEVEMSALRAQMNPHFVFNSLNSINKYILTNEPRTASRYLTKFSQLMRLILNNSKHKEISLQQELEALRLYIELEQVRCEHRFDFREEVRLQSATSAVQIPPMLIQPYIENAIWHGLMPLDHQGMLLLRLEQQDGTLVCTIEDNGIGRRRAIEINERKGGKRDSHGMHITSKRIKLVEAVHEISADVLVEDKHNAAGNATGTRVRLILPLKITETQGDG
jgi:sensor histidine kinase YesM